MWGQGAKPLESPPSLQLLCVHGDGEADFVAEPVGGGIFDGDIVLVKGETAHHQERAVVGDVEQVALIRRGANRLNRVVEAAMMVL